MPVTIDEVTAEVAPPESNAGPPPPAAAQPGAPAHLRQVRDQCERIKQRAARVSAD